MEVAAFCDKVRMRVQKGPCELPHPDLSLCRERHCPRCKGDISRASKSPNVLEGPL